MGKQRKQNKPRFIAKNKMDMKPIEEVRAVVENPEIGGQYWFVTDIWERFCPVPVTIVAVNEEYGAFLVRWDIGESEYFEQYEGVWPNELYETQEGAAAECQRRNALPRGYVEKVVNYLEE